MQDLRLTNPRTWLHRSRRFVDFSGVVQETELEQSYYVEQAEHVHRLCRILAKNDVAALVSQMETWQQQEEGRELRDINMREEVCVQLLGECEAEATVNSDEDEDKDEL